MKKKLYVFLAIVTCIVFMTGCGLFHKLDSDTADNETQTSETDNKDTSDVQNDADDTNDADDVPVSTPNDTSSTEDEQSDDTDSSNSESNNPQDNVANDTDKEFTATGKYCGFVDSTSVEIELSDGSYCTFFAYEDDVRNTLSGLNEEEMPEISFTYKAREGQINPEMIAVTVK